MASLTLTAQDQRRLRRAIATVASPLCFPGVDAWRGATNRSLKELLGADMAGFDLPTPGRERMYSDEYDPAEIRRYHDVIAPLDERVRIFERLQRQRVTTRTRAWGRDLSRFYRSAYYNDYVVAIRAYDPLMAHARYPDLDSAAALYFHHEKPTGRKFGERGLGLLRLVYPAFEAAAHFCLAFARRREQVTRMADMLEEPAALYDRSGRLLHRNCALRTLLAREPKGELARRIGRFAARTAAGAADGRSPEPGGWSGRLTTGAGRYALRATLLGAGPADWARVLVVVTPPGRSLPSARELRHRFGLTTRQAEVALLLARRRTNREIAQALTISPHTARRHTEKVLLKLDVESRREVRGAVHGASPTDVRVPAERPFAFRGTRRVSGDDAPQPFRQTRSCR